MLSRVYDKVRKYVYPIVLAAGLLLCVAWSISPLRDRLVKAQWIDDRTIFGVLGVLVTITIFELQQHEKTSKKLSDSVAQFSPVQTSSVEFGGVGAVYTKFNPIVKRMVEESRAETTIDVLGLTLFSAWPVGIAPQIQNGEIRNCTVNLYLMSPKFIEANSELFPKEWLAHVQSKPQEISAFLQTHQATLKKNNVTVNVQPYAFFPGVHGFRTSEGHLMISFIHWAQKTVDDPNQFYEIFTGENTSARARAYRDLFKNWVDRAEREQATAPQAAPAGVRASAQ